ncbi:MAG TPA: ABC transporter ATP-binding protein [Candidatus Eisenbacteria bacterium]
MTDDRLAGRPTASRNGSIDQDPREIAVRTVGLTKLYRNPWTLKVTAGLVDLDLEVRRGEVMGYLGANGAGKTTTLKLLTGLHKPTRGGAWIFGESVERTASRRRIGFLPEQPYFYDYLTGHEYLELAGRLSGLEGREAHERARRWMGRVGLGAAGRRSLRKYSKGMLQRLGLAAALIHAPDLLMLDEPMSGLDPLGRRDVRDLLLEQRERGVTVLFSSHILPDVEMLCDRVAIVRAGRLTRLARVGELVSGGPQRVEIRCEGRLILERPAALGPLLTRIERPEETALVLERSERLGEVLRWLLEAGARVRAVTPQRSSLEDLYLEAAGAEVPERAGERRSA